CSFFNELSVFSGIEACSGNDLEQGAGKCGECHSERSPENYTRSACQHTCLSEIGCQCSQSSKRKQGGSRHNRNDMGCRRDNGCCKGHRSAENEHARRSEGGLDGFCTDSLVQTQFIPE